MKSLIITTVVGLAGCSTLQPTCALDNLEVETANTFTGETDGRRITVFASDERCWDVLERAMKLHEKGKL